MRKFRLESALDLIPQGGVTPGASRQPGRIDAPGDMGMVGRRAIGNTLQIGSTPMRLAMIIDER